MSTRAIKEVLACENELLADMFEADRATRDTNDGSTYCSECGAPQPKRNRKWAHDPLCTVDILRDRAKEHRMANPKGGK